MFSEHQLLNHNNLWCLFCFGRLRCPLEFDTLQRGGDGAKKWKIMSREQFCLQEAKLCPSLLPLRVDVIPPCLAKHQQLTSWPSCINYPFALLLALTSLSVFLSCCFL